MQLEAIKSTQASESILNLIVALGGPIWRGGVLTCIQNAWLMMRFRAQKYYRVRVAVARPYFGMISLNPTQCEVVSFKPKNYRQLRLSPPQTMDPCRAKTMRSGRISLGTAPLGDSKLHHLVEYTSYSIFYVVVYAQASLCGADSSISAFIK